MGLGAWGLGFGVSTGDLGAFRGFESVVWFAGVRFIRVFQVLSDFRSGFKGFTLC